MTAAAHPPSFTGAAALLSRIGTFGRTVAFATSPLEGEGASPLSSFCLAATKPASTRRETVFSRSIRPSFRSLNRTTGARSWASRNSDKSTPGRST